MHGKHEEKICPRCQNTFECAVGNITLCSCSTVKLSKATTVFLANSSTDCLCKNCLADLNQKIERARKETFPPPKLLENTHFYIENGLFVFTEWYHLLRGHCCQNGCRHCAYGFKKEEKAQLIISNCCANDGHQDIKGDFLLL